MAKMRSSTVRKTPILPCGVTTQRAPRCGISSMVPMSNQVMVLLRRFGELGCGHRLELMLVLAGHAFRPRIDLCELLAEDEAFEVTLAPLEIVEDLTFDFSYADALGPFVDPLEITRLLAVHL